MGLRGWVFDGTRGLDVLPLSGFKRQHCRQLLQAEQRALVYDGCACRARRFATRRASDEPHRRTNGLLFKKGFTRLTHDPHLTYQRPEQLGGVQLEHGSLAPRAGAQASGGVSTLLRALRRGCGSLL